MADDVVRGKEFPKKLRVEMSHDEIEKKGREAGKLKKKRNEVRAKQKAAKDQFKEELLDITSRLDAVLDDLEQGGEERNVRCVEEKDFKRNVVRTIRLDTNDVVETRPLSPEERQEMIGGADGDAAEEKPKRGRGRGKKDQE